MHKSPKQIARSLRAFRNAQRMGLLRCVRIAPGPNACEAARSQRGIEYLGNAIPRLPLAQCVRAAANATIFLSEARNCAAFTSANHCRRVTATRSKKEVRTGSEACSAATGSSSGSNASVGLSLARSELHSSSIEVHETEWIFTATEGSYLLSCIKRPFRLAFEINPEVVMSEKIKSEMISRRQAFSLLGLAGALSLVVPAAVITATDAEARVGNPASAVSVAGANRRDRRQDRRYKKKKPMEIEEKK